MDCAKARGYIYSLIDGELDKNKSVLVEEHIRACPLCGLELKQEKEMDNLLRRSITREKAPYEMNENVLKLIKASKWRGLYSYVRSLLKPPFMAYAAACVALLLLFSVFINMDKTSPIFSDSIKKHIQFLHGDTSPDFVSDEPQEIYRWLQARLNFNVMVPDLSSQDARILGARLCTIEDKEAAYIIYEKSGHNISVFMFNGKGAKFPGARRIAMNDKMFYLYRGKGYNSALWLDKGIGCVFVSDLNESELLYLASR